MRAVQLPSRWCALALLAAAALAQGPPAPDPKPEPKPDPPAPVSVAENAPLTSAEETKAAASLRNENIYINRIDNNVLRDALVRLGASITMITDPGVALNYYAAEFGQPLEEFPFLKPHSLTGWHGQLFGSHQNSVFNARTFFQVGPIQPSHQNFYGFQAGGPLGALHKLSFEAEQLKTRGMVNGNVLVPTPQERTPLTGDPRAAALIRRFLGAFPNLAPNRTEIDPRALNTNSPQLINQDRLLGRWDLSLGGDRKLWTQYQYQNQFVDAFQLVDGQNPDTTLASQQARITWAQLFAGSGAWTLGAAFDRVRTALAPEPNAVGPFVRFSRMIESLGPRSEVPIDRMENTFRGGAQLAWASGVHRLTAGAEFARHQLNGRESRDHRGHFNFSYNFGRTAVENFLLGTPTSYEVSLGDSTRGFRSSTFQAYLGDDWQLSPHWRLNLGLRYGLDTAPREVNGRTEVPYRCDCNNLSPRFGFAFQGGPWGVLRGAYTLSFSQIIPATYQQARFNPPGIISIELTNPDLLDPLRGIDLRGLASGLRSGLFLLDSGLRDPYSHQYTLNWERRFRQDWRVRLGYVGSRAFQLFSPLVLNRARRVPGVEHITATVNQRRPDQRYYEVTRVSNMNNAYLDAAQVSLTLPGRRGLSFTAAYTFAKALDTGADYTSTGSGEDIIYDAGQTEFDIHQDLKGLSRFDSTHAVLLNFSYDLPAARHGSRFRRGLLDGWNLSGAGLFKSGTPFTARLGSDAPGFGNVDGKQSERPNLLDPAVLGRTVDHPDTSRQRLPASAFSPLAPDQDRGNLGRATFRRDGIDNLNLALTKHWTLPSASAERRLLFRAEALNAFNHPQFDEPGVSLVNPNFGAITNTRNEGRIFQFSLRLIF